MLAGNATDGAARILCLSPNATECFKPTSVKLHQKWTFEESPIDKLLLYSLNLKLLNNESRMIEIFFVRNVDF